MRDRLTRVYRVLEPNRSAYFLNSWFRRRLSEEGMIRTRQTVTRWLAGDPMPHAGWLVLTALEREARRKLREEQEQIG